MAVVTMKQLLEAGVHFGHQTRRWNPKMQKFIFGERNGIYIIDLQQSLRRIEEAYRFIRDTVAGGGNVLFIGTKKQAQEPVEEYATKCGMPYINHRWLGGTLTNFQTISKRVGKMLEYERMRDAGDFTAMPKKEALQFQRELDKLERYLGGLRGMNQRPEAVFVLDTKKEAIAVTEANKLGIPVVAVVDTNCDPDVIDYIIPGNDDAIRSATLMCRVVADAVTEGRLLASTRADIEATSSAGQDTQIDVEQAEARREALAETRESEAREAAQARRAARRTAASAAPSTAEAVPHEAQPDEALPDEAVPEEATAEAVPDEAEPDEAVSTEQVPDQSAGDRAAPEPDAASSTSGTASPEADDEPVPSTRED